MSDKNRAQRRAQDKQIEKAAKVSTMHAVGAAIGGPIWGDQVVGTGVWVEPEINLETGLIVNHRYIAYEFQDKTVAWVLKPLLPHLDAMAKVGVWMALTCRGYRLLPDTADTIEDVRKHAAAAAVEWWENEKAQGVTEVGL